MVYTPSGALVIRSREYGDNSEYDSADSLDIIPDHYVKRLWRKPAVPTTASFILGSGGSGNLDGGLKMQVSYINKTPNSSDRSVAFSSLSDATSLVIRHGESGSEIFRVEWNLKSMDKSSITIGTKTTAVKDILKKTGIMGSSGSRTFLAPDGVEYKWKQVLCGSNPAFPDSMYRELYAKDSKHPVATTARLASRDGAFSDESHPIYISERGLTITAWIIATLAILDRLQAE